VIIVTELPYLVNKAGWIEKIAELINAGRIEGIADLRDESDREGMRVVIELKREAQPQTVLDQLYRQTALQTNFGVIMLAVVEGQPRQMGLREVLQQFLDFREETLTRRYRHQLEQAQSRLHLVTGLLTTLDHLDAVIEILRRAADGSTAKLELQARFDFSDRQADAILSMPLRRLTGLEQQNLRTEFEQLSQQIQQLETLLGSRHELLKALKKDLRALKRQYADPRRTRLHAEPAPLLSLTAVESDTEVSLEVNQRGYVRWQRTADKPRRANGNGALSRSLQELKKDLAVYSQQTRLSEELLAFTQGGKVYSVEVRDIPSGDRRGTPLVTLLPDTAQSEILVNQLIAPSSEGVAQSLVLLTQQGRIKRVAVSDLSDITARGLNVCKLKDQDQMIWAALVPPDAEVVIATSSGRLLRFTGEEIPLMGRSTLGQAALRLRLKETIVGGVVVQPYDNLLLVSQKGYGKRMPVGAARPSRLGDIGTPSFQFALKTDALAAIAPAPPDSEVTFVTNQNRAAILAIDEIPIWGKEGTGKALLTLTSGEVINLVLV
jgi:DNA gyrase subunit A